MGNKLYEDSSFVDEATLTHTKLNTFNSRISNGFVMVSGALAALGGDDRVIDDQDVSSELQIVESTPADMNINVNIGYAIVSEMLVRNESAAVLTVVAPTSSNRADIVQISNEGVLSTKSSAEQAVPVEPSADANNLKLYGIYLPQNTNKIQNSDGGFGYLIDRRVYSLHPTTIKRHMSRFFSGTMDTAGGANSDGYMWGTSATGSTFGDDVNVDSVGVTVVDIPTGANLVFKLWNVTDGTSSSATLTAGSAFEEDATVDLALDAADEFAIQCVTVGSGEPGGWADLDIKFSLA